MAILNYTTQISADKTAAEISKLLALAGAEAVMTEYSPAGPYIERIAFRIKTQHGVVNFLLPTNTEKVFQVLTADRKVPTKFKNREQAARVGLRIVKDWLEAQLAIIRTEMVTVAQAFLPYAQTTTGETLYDALQSTRFKTLALPAA